MDKPKLWLNFTLKYFRRRPSILAVPNQGWTLIEVTAVVMIVGILSSMAFPSFGRMQAKNELRSAMSEVESAFREAQRNAMKRSATCTVNITAGAGFAGTINSSSTPGCIPLEVVMPDDEDGGSVITLSISPPSSTSINFSYKGNPDIGSDRTISLTSSVSNLEPRSRCLVISPGIGLMRSGYIRNGGCETAL